MRRSDKRDFLMLAHSYREQKDKRSIGGWYLSEKLDGQLVFYDGGITRGMLCSDVLFANTVKDKKEVYATGLWTRGGKPVQAPGWFLDQLPPRFLAGELYAGRGNFQITESAVRKHQPVDHEWKSIKLHAFDTPSVEAFCQPGRIHVRSWRVTWGAELLSFVQKRISKIGGIIPPFYDFEAFVNKGMELENDIIKVVQQTALPFSDKLAANVIENTFNELVASGAEGVILRHPGSRWEPTRSNDYLKYKEEDDAEGEVVGYRTGKITNDGSRNLGRMGSLIVKWNGLTFDINGFTDQERELEGRNLGGVNAPAWAEQFPNEECPGWIINSTFPIGSLVTFKYNGLTDDGIPRSANYLRKRVSDE